MKRFLLIVVGVMLILAPLLALDAPTLSAPANGSTYASDLTPTLEWAVVATADTYDVHLYHLNNTLMYLPLENSTEDLSSDPLTFYVWNNAVPDEGYYGSGYGGFDGTGNNACLNSTDISKLNSTVGTIAFWMKEHDANAVLSPLSIGARDTDATVTRISAISDTRTSSNIFSVIAHTDGTKQWKWVTGTGFMDSRFGNWLHVAIVQNGTEPLIYFDGSLWSNITKDTTTDTTIWIDDLLGATSPAENVMVGCYMKDQPTNEFNGTIDEVRIFDVALGAEEVELLYNGSAHYQAEDIGTNSNTTTGLTPFHTYEWRARAINASESSSWSGIFDFTLSPDATAPVATITQYNSSITQQAQNLTVTWEVDEANNDTTYLEITDPYGTIINRTYDAGTYVYSKALFDKVGRWKLYAWANDTAGQSGDDTEYFNVVEPVAYETAVGIGLALIAFIFVFIGLSVDEKHPALTFFFLVLGLVTMILTLSVVSEIAMVAGQNNIAGLGRTAMHGTIWGLVVVVAYFFIHLIRCAGMGEPFRIKGE